MPRNIVQTNVYQVETLENPPQKVPQAIAVKLAKMLRWIKQPKKSGELRFYENVFKYSNRDDIAEVVHPALNEAGLSIVPAIVSVEEKEVVCVDYRGNERISFDYTVVVKLTLIDSDTGESWWQYTVAKSTDNQDKGIPKATTQALRHWFINTFHLTDGGEESLYVEEMKEQQNNQRPRRGEEGQGRVQHRPQASERQNSAPEPPQNPLFEKSEEEIYAMCRALVAEKVDHHPDVDLFLKEANLRMDRGKNYLVNCYERLLHADKKEFAERFKNMVFKAKQLQEESFDSMVQE